MIQQEPIFKNVTRPTTPDERAQIESIQLNEEDVDYFVEQFRKGLMKASTFHEAAVQNNAQISTEVTIRMSRPVLNPVTDRVEELVGRETITHNIQMQKKYKS